LTKKKRKKEKRETKNFRKKLLQSFKIYVKKHKNIFEVLGFKKIAKV